MKLFSPVQLTRLTRPRDEVGVDRDLLPRAAAGQEPDENREVLEAGNELLYPHHDDVHRRNAGDEPGVTLVGNRGHGARLGHPEVGTRNADVGGQELLAQASAGKGAQGLDVGRELFSRRPGQDLRYAFTVHVQDGPHDVRGRVARELRDPLPEVRLHDLQVEVGVVLLEPLVELYLFGRHALGLGDDLRALAPRKIPDITNDVLAIRRKEDVAAARLYGVGHLFQVAVEVGHRLLLYAVSPLPELRRLGQGIEDSVAPDDGLVGEELDRVVELFVCDGPARPVVEALDPATYALVAAVLRLALQGWFPGLQDLNQPFRYRAPGRGGARGCRGPCASGGLPGASGNWSRLRSGCQRRSLPTPLSSRQPSRWTRRASSQQKSPRTRNTTPRSATPQGRVPPRSGEARTARRVRRARAAGDSRSGRRLSPPGVPRGPSRPSR